MALINCTDCGREVSDKAGKCPNCGCPIEVVNEKDEMHDLYVAVNAFSPSSSQNIGPEEKVPASTGRLVTGIVFIVISVVVLFQSCAVGVANALDGSKGGDGTLGVMTFLLLLIVGIVSISTRKSQSYKIPGIIAGILMIYGFLISYIYTGRYGDLKIWGWIMLICSLVYIADAKKNYRK